MWFIIQGLCWRMLQVLPSMLIPQSAPDSGQASSRASLLCSKAMASAECLHFSDPHWQVKYLLLMSQKRSP